MTEKQHLCHDLAAQLEDLRSYIQGQNRLYLTYMDRVEDLAKSNLRVNRMMALSVTLQATSVIILAYAVFSQ